MNHGILATRPAHFAARSQGTDARAGVGTGFTATDNPMNRRERDAVNTAIVIAKRIKRPFTARAS